MSEAATQSEKSNKKFICDTCEKSYAHKASLYNHKKICNSDEPSTAVTSTTDNVNVEKPPAKAEKAPKAEKTSAKAPKAEKPAAKAPKAVKAEKPAAKVETREPEKKQELVVKQHEQHHVDEHENEHENEHSNSEEHQECEEEEEDQNVIIPKRMLIALIQDNKRMKELLISQNEIICNLTQATSYSESMSNKPHRQTINSYLNTQFSDVISFDHFVENLEVSLKSLLITKDDGLIQGITNIFVENLKKFAVNERPIHCIDTKTCNVYIKTDEKWEKDIDREKFKEAIQTASRKQAQNIKLWKEVNPDCMSSSKGKDDFVQLVKNITEDIDDKVDKIIKNICKVIYLSKPDDV